MILEIYCESKKFEFQSEFVSLILCYTIQTIQNG